MYERHLAYKKKRKTQKSSFSQVQRMLFRNAILAGEPSYKQDM